MSPLYLVVAVYIAISFPCFYIVYNASHSNEIGIVDEEFHVPQGKHYCLGNFDIWDKKITTLPGLYILSAIFLLPFKQCSTFALRLTSLFASIVNVCLIFEIRRCLQQKVNPIKIAMETLTLSLLPPIFLFAHLYYTDVCAITFVLGMFLFNIKQRHNISALFGFASVLMRQTNIVWVGMILSSTIMDKIISQTLPFVKNESICKKDSEKRTTNSYNFQDIVSVFWFYSKRVYLVPKQIRLLLLHLCGYILTIVAFIAFIFVNGSIVVGDKSAHEAAIHLPQLFYYSIFFTIFAPSITLTYMEPTLRIFKRHWILWILAGILSIIVIYANTIVHPYLLADNRHYLFYIWNKFYGRYWWFRYSMVPLYLISIAVMYQCISIRSAGFQILYTLCTIVSIALQQLIEFRYFILPFMIARLFSSSVKFKFLIIELILHLIVNSITLYLFATKEIYWKNYDFVQRIIW